MYDEREVIGELSQDAPKHAILHVTSDVWYMLELDKQAGGLVGMATHATEMQLLGYYERANYSLSKSLSLTRICYSLVINQLMGHLAYAR